MDQKGRGDTEKGNIDIFNDRFGKERGYWKRPGGEIERGERRK